MTNKFKTLIAAGAVLATAATMAPQKANAASQTGTASATVLAALAITENTLLTFGSFETDGNAGTVVLTTGGARTPSGGVTLGPTAGAAGSFSIAGTASASISIPAITGITLTGPGTAMAVAFDITGSPTALDGGGAATLDVGGTLTVNASQAAGAYSGTYTVVVNYN